MVLTKEDSQFRNSTISGQRYVTLLHVRGCLHVHRGRGWTRVVCMNWYWVWRGFYYVGPIDGHDMPTLVAVLENLKKVAQIHQNLSHTTPSPQAFAQADMNPSHVHDQYVLDFTFMGLWVEHLLLMWYHMISSNCPCPHLSASSV